MNLEIVLGNFMLLWGIKFHGFFPKSNSPILYHILDSAYNSEFFRLWVCSYFYYLHFPINKAQSDCLDLNNEQVR